MKRLISLLLVIVCVMSVLVSCNDGKDSTADSATQDETPFTPSIIQVSITAVANANHSFTVSTNLPDGTSLMLTLFSADNSYRAQDKVYVYGGKATSSVFSNKGTSLNGEYTLEVLMPVASQQSKEVQKIIGSNCEYLAGELVAESSYGLGKTVEASFNFTLAARKSAEDIIKETAYNDLTKSQKLSIIYWIEARYEYYDGIAGGYAGDKYTKTIFNEAAARYNKTYQQIDAIWKQSYELKYN